jgi:hypothetical protein
MGLSALETIVAVLQSGVFVLLASFYLNEVLSKKDLLARPDRRSELCATHTALIVDQA